MVMRGNGIHTLVWEAIESPKNRSNTKVSNFTIDIFTIYHDHSSIFGGCGSFPVQGPV